MRRLLPIRSFLFLMILLVSFVTLSGCMMHPGHGSDGQEQTAVLHDGHAAATVQAIPTAASNPEEQRHQHESHGMMPMMHGAGGWHWLGMGAMMAVMVLVVL